MQYIIKDEIFQKETLLSINIVKFKDFTLPNHTSSGFNLSIKFCIKRILTTTEYCNLQYIQHCIISCELSILLYLFIFI